MARSNALIKTTARNAKAKPMAMAGNAVMRANEAMSILRARLASFMGYSHGGNRDLYESFGYSRHVQPEELYALYLRNDIANRALRAFPAATWRSAPIVSDGPRQKPGTPLVETPFAKAVSEFLDNHNILRMLERADRVSGIGRYGVLVMGFADGKPMDKPLVPGPAKLRYLTPYSEISCQIAKWDSDIESPRFGMPEIYNLQNHNLEGMNRGPNKFIRVHYTRVLHLSEFLDQDEVFGIPRLLPVHNRLKDLEKVVGGSAETFWITANRGLALWADKEAQLDDDERLRMEQSAKDFQNNLTRTLVGTGMQAQVLGSEDPDPGPNATILLDLIAGALGIPKRILLGTERGELSSAQDENNWAARIDERRHNFAVPSILKPFLRLMIATGNIPRPTTDKWWIEWTQLASLDPSAQAAINAQKVAALTSYAATPTAELVVPVQEFRVAFLGLDPESAYAIPELEPEEETDDQGNEPPPDGETVPPKEQGGEEENSSSASRETPPDDRETKPQPKANMAPKPLYVSRKVLNSGAIIKWAKEQGFKNLEPADELHVTVMYSPSPVDWLACTQAFGEDEDGSLMIHPGGPRVVEEFGQNKEAVVLSFSNDGLQWRHRELLNAGCKHTFGRYQPHITITKMGRGTVDMAKVQPYTGAIALGPEIFEDLNQ